MPQTEAEYKAAYDAGWHASEKEWDYDPGKSMPDDVLGMPTTARIPVYVPGFQNGNHTDGILGVVEIYGNVAILKLQDGEDFQKRLENGAYIGMSVQFAQGYDASELYKSLDWSQPKSPQQVLSKTAPVIRLRDLPVGTIIKDHDKGRFELTTVGKGDDPVRIWSEVDPHCVDCAVLVGEGDSRLDPKIGNLQDVPIEEYLSNWSVYLVPPGTSEDLLDQINKFNEAQIAHPYHR